MEPDHERNQGTSSCGFEDGVVVLLRADLSQPGVTHSEIWHRCGRRAAGNFLHETSELRGRRIGAY